MTDDALRAAALRVAGEHGLDPEEVLAALDAERGLPPDLRAVLSGLGDALTAVAVAGSASNT